MGSYGTPKVWEPMQPTRAVCSDYASHHEAPWAGHECGLWALKDFEAARKRLLGWISTFWCGDPVGVAIGQVSLWGRVIEHEKGYRAQYAYPFALTLETLEEEQARAIRREYAVDVEWAGGELYEACVAKRLRREERAAQKKATLDQEYEQTMARIDAIIEKSGRSLSTWDVMSKLRYGKGARERLLAYLEAAIESSGGDPVSSLELAVHILTTNGLSTIDARDHLGALSHDLKEAFYARDAVQVKRTGAAVAFWTRPGKPIPTRFRVYVCPHEAADDAMLERFRALSAKRKGGPIGTSDLVPVGSGRRERTLVGQSLGRLGLRGVIRENRRTGSQPNEWVLADSAS
jgi:hypothetical protein